MAPVSKSLSGWSPDSAIWNALEGLGRSLTWRKVDLDRNRSHLVAAAYGVYLIGARPPSRAIAKLGFYTVLYAGQVKGVDRNLRIRFLEHISRPNPILRRYIHSFYPALHFWFAVTTERSLIDDIETLLIRTFNPPCNSIDAPGAKVLLARVGAGRPIGAGHHQTT